jgi:hypothetical protein
LCDDESGEPNATARALAQLRLPLLIANHGTAAPARHLNLSSQVLALMRDAGTEVFAYVATNWGSADRKRTLRAVDECLAGDLDGVFFDEADALCSEENVEYYAALAAGVRARGAKLILNAGVARCGEKIMELCDRLMVEHAWRDARTRSPWLRRYAADRVMGVSSNEDNAMGYAVDEQRAIRDTHEAWQAGIGWHTSTNRYVELPEWFGRYVSAIE